MVLSIYTGAGGWSFDIYATRNVGPFNIYGSRKLGLSIYTVAGSLSVAGGWFFQYIR